MNLTGSTEYLQLLIETLDVTVIPNVQTTKAQSAVAEIRESLVELLRRSTTTPRILTHLIADGFAIADDVVHVLVDANSANIARFQEVLNTASLMRVSSEDFYSLRISYNAITYALDCGARYIAELRNLDIDYAARGSNRMILAVLRRIAEWECSYYVQQKQASPPFRTETTGLTRKFSEESLQQFLRASRIEWASCQVDRLAELSGGMTKDTYLASISRAPGLPSECVVRKAELDPVLQLDAFVLANEFDLVACVHEAGFAVARPLVACSDRRFSDGTFYLMQRMPGVMPGNFFGPTMEISSELLMHIATLLAQLHSYPLEKFSVYIDRHESPALLTQTMEECYRDQLIKWRGYLHSAPLLSSPILTYVLDWLVENMPADRSRPVLVHGDFNIHNMLVFDQRVCAVLDWECATFGSPQQDLSYIKPHIERMGDWNEFIKHYVAHGGRVFDEKDFNYYLTFSMLRLLIGTNRAIRKLALGESRDIRSTTADLGYWPQFIATILKQTGSIPVFT